MISSSIQATLIGRYGESDYGKSKLAGEELFFNYGKEVNAKVLVYRFPNLFGKWCRPNYNSVVATFCNNIANDLDIQVNDRSTQLEMLYIDDLVQEVAYQNSKRNKFNDKQRRKQVLDNYFKGDSYISKFPSKHKIEKAIKNINYEMEKASQEFSKLFNYDDKTK